jgi:predicted acyltransferase
MTATATALPSTGIAGQTTSARVLSIDIFRGLTMAVMIFVNDLASVHGLSKWTYHMPADVDAMTYVDMVFPAFLFIVGMALPLAIRQRLRRDPSRGKLWLHIVLRALALLVLGLILANVHEADPARMPVPPYLWAILGLLGGILLWNVYPGVNRRLVLILRATGAALLVFVFAVFRSATPAGETWLHFGYPEILGLIAFAYLAACLLYVPTRRWRFAPVVWLVVLVAYNAAHAAHWLRHDDLPIYVWPFGNGALVSLVMAGVVTSLIFLEDGRTRSATRRIGLGLLLAIACLAAGWLLRPLGISKIRATPTWALWSMAASCALFTALYWLCDVRQRTRWAWLVRPAGSNTLLTYLIPDLYYFLVAWTGTAALLGHWNHGWPGVVRALAFTVAMLLVAHAATKARQRMQL